MVMRPACFQSPHSIAGIGPAKAKAFVALSSGVCFHEAMLAHYSVMYQVDNTSYSNEPLPTELTSYELLSFRHLNNVRKKSKFQGGSTSTRICVAPTCA